MSTVLNLELSPASQRRPFHHSHSYEVLDVEFEIQDKTGPCICSFASEPPHIALLKYKDIPAFLKGNPYVHSGYRAYLSGASCLRSLFIWSNETVNIWSHLVGFIIFFLLMLLDNFYMIPRLSGSLSDHVVVTLGLICYQFCMICSTGYHLFACHSERANHRWLALDLAGICVGLIGCYLPAIHFAFYCLSIWRDIYLFMASFLCLMVLTFQLIPQFAKAQFWYARIFIFVGLAGFGVVPTFHWVVLNGGLSAEIVQLFFHKVVVIYGIGAMALVIYMTKFPERAFPGRVDYLGSSHQLWHILVVLAFLWWHQAGGEMLAYRTSNMCYF